MAQIYKGWIYREPGRDYINETTDAENIVEEAFNRGAFDGEFRERVKAALTDMMNDDAAMDDFIKMDDGCLDMDTLCENFIREKTNEFFTDGQDTTFLGTVYHYHEIEVPDGVEAWRYVDALCDGEFHDRYGNDPVGDGTEASQ